MTAPVIEVVGLSKTYRLGPVAVEALREVSLTILRGSSSP